jgi:hypothetical protein
MNRLFVLAVALTGGVFGFFNWVAWLMARSENAAYLLFVFMLVDMLIFLAIAMMRAAVEGDEDESVL